MVPIVLDDTAGATCARISSVGAVWVDTAVQCINVHLYYAAFQNLVCRCGPLLKAATHHQYIVPNMCSNPSICPSSLPLAYNATLFKWLKMFNRSMYSLAGHGCTLEWMLQTLFTSQSTTVTACRVKTEDAKTSLLITIWLPWLWQMNHYNPSVCTYYTLVPMNTVLEGVAFFSGSVSVFALFCTMYLFEV